MCFLLNMYNIIVKNKDNYSLCGNNLYFVKCTNVFKIITKWFLVSDGIDKDAIFSLSSNY